MSRLRKVGNEDMSSLRSWLNVITMSGVTQGEIDDFCSTFKEINA